ncbi:uncharacterized protein LOC124183826 isoform X2 [Neodiprion fabricii]|uniref:uncharacterized protein LOC124183826 isoform X2 n=1 Tax=Neodiprion fabricii TaxID=2872261 RepID=UPI001ED94DA6|nr:uncharacterized protein LOC124183826 isoform X2 [Neodiprion fabricii]
MRNQENCIDSVYSNINHKPSSSCGADIHQHIEELRWQQEVPAEWEAWLRYRRKEPPSDAEVLQSLALMKTKKKNAAELESALEATRSSKSKPAPLPEAIGFPTYKDYQYPEGFKDSKE